MPFIPTTLYDAFDIEAVQEHTEKISLKFEEYVKNKEIIFSWFDPSIYQIDIESLNSSIISKLEELKTNLKIPQSNLNIIKNIEEYGLCLKKEYEDIRHIIKDIRIYANFLNLFPTMKPLEK